MNSRSKSGSQSGKFETKEGQNMNTIEAKYAIHQAQSDLSKLNLIVKEINAELGTATVVKPFLIYNYIPEINLILSI